MKGKKNRMEKIFFLSDFSRGKFVFFFFFFLLFSWFPPLPSIKKNLYARIYSLPSLSSYPPPHSYSYNTYTKRRKHFSLGLFNQRPPSYIFISPFCFSSLPTIKLLLYNKRRGEKKDLFVPFLPQVILLYSVISLIDFPNLYARACK